MEEALDFFFSLEPTSDVSPLEHIEYYENNCIKYAKEIEMAEQAIKTYGEQIEPKTFENMQKKFRDIVDSNIHYRLMSSVIESAWDGIGPW
ncbi:MAG: hypothetical protein SFW07_07615 [Gammaproteobacteria bacterium]|nr:hypothetical protein [Gammaproteobacteria bacterium]